MFVNPNFIVFEIFLVDRINFQCYYNFVESEVNSVTLGERIKKLRRDLGLTQREFGQRISIKQNSVAQIEMGRNTSEQTIVAICKEFNVSESWLRTGEGDMFVPMSRDEEIAAFVGKTLSTETDTFQKRFISMLSRLSTSDWEALEHMVEGMKKD